MELPAPQVMALELLPGGSLEARLAAGPLPEAVALAVAADCLAALEAVHAANIIHRDVKPDNIVSNGAAVEVWKLVDVGARPLSSRSDDCGLPAYLD
jgi:serine/threonine-protein kinase